MMVHVSKQGNGLWYVSWQVCNGYLGRADLTNEQACVLLLRLYGASR